MHHIMAIAPAVFDADQLRDELNDVHPGCVSVIGYDDQVAAIYPDAETCPTTTELGLVLSAHVPVARSSDPLHVLARAIAAATSLDDIKPAAIAILTDGAQ